VYRIVKRLEQKGLLQRLQRGKYVLQNFSTGAQNNHFIMAMHLVDPASIGYWSAMHYHGLTEQIPQTVFIQTTVRKRKTSALADYKFITVKKEKFFGLRKEWVSHLSFMVTDFEKTLVDCCDYPEYCGGIAECSKAFINAEKNINPEKLINYAIEMKNSAIVKRIGYIAENISIKNIIAEIQNRKITLSPKYSILDTSLGNSGNYSSKWKLRINTEIKRDIL
jgi:predicted transcriptional regulator of viral defense system